VDGKNRLVLQRRDQFLGTVHHVIRDPQVDSDAQRNHSQRADVQSPGAYTFVETCLENEITEQESRGKAHTELVQIAPGGVLLYNCAQNQTKEEGEDGQPAYDAANSPNSNQLAVECNGCLPVVLLV